jgi:hypothetical protein
MKRWIPALVLVGIVAMLAAWIFWSRAREPKYEGKTLSYWFKEYCRSGEYMRYDLTRNEETLAALKRLGTDAVPYLIEQTISTNEDSAAMTNFCRILDVLPASWNLPRPLTSWVMSEEAPIVLREIKPPAWQLLALMEKPLKSTNHFERRQALFILGTVGDGAEQVVPYLVTAVKDTNDWGGPVAIKSLGWIGPRAREAVPALIEVLQEFGGTNQPGIGWTTAITLGKIGVPAPAAVPLVRKMFEQETNWNLRCGLASALFRIDPSQTDALDFLTDGVTNHQPANARWIAAEQLATIGPSAKAAIPALLQALESTNDNLLFVVPRALTNMGVAPQTFLPLMKKQLEATEDAPRITAAVCILEVDPTDHDSHLVLMKTMEQGAVYQDYAIEMLSRAGPAAEEAIPVLRRLAKHDPQGRRDRELAAARALKRIEAKGKN